MDLRTIRARRQVGQDLDRRLAAQVPPHPREAAITYIRDAIEAGLAGLDCYDPAVFILDAHPFERTWANRALELVGIVEGHRMWAGAIPYRATLDAEVRRDLGLDRADSPTLVEPLASRAVREACLPVDVTIASLASPEPRPLLQVVEAEPVSAAAMSAAKDAYNRRFAEKGLALHGHGQGGPAEEVCEPGMIGPRDEECSCEVSDVGTGETGPSIAVWIDESCPVHGAETPWSKNRCTRYDAREGQVQS